MSVTRIAQVGISLALVLAAGALVIELRRDATPTSPAAAVAVSEAKMIEVVDPVHDRPFEVSMWPASGEDKRTLVVLSHGFAGDRTSHTDLANELAAAGFVVAAPTHPDLAGLESNDRQLDPLVLRPRHLSLTIDHVSREASEPFDRVVIVGHSLGGYSALRVAGGNPSATGHAEYCDVNPTDAVLCSAAARERIDVLVSDGHDFGDPRVDAIVLLAPGYGPLFSRSDLEPIQVDTLVVAASSDRLLPGRQVDALVDALPEGATYDTVDGGHYIFLRTCTSVEQQTMPDLCVDDASADRAATNYEVGSAIETLLRG